MTKRTIKLEDAKNDMICISDKELSMNTWIRCHNHNIHLSPYHAITSKDQIKYVYECKATDMVDLLIITRQFTEEERIKFIEEKFNNLPDTRQIKFIITDFELNINDIYFIIKSDEFKIYDSLKDIITDKIDLTNMYLYSIDLVQNTFWVNESCEDIIPTLQEAITLL